MALTDASIERYTDQGRVFVAWSKLDILSSQSTSSCLLLTTTRKISVFFADVFSTVDAEVKFWVGGTPVNNPASVTPFCTNLVNPQTSTVQVKSGIGVYDNAGTTILYKRLLAESEVAIKAPIVIGPNSTFCIQYLQPSMAQSATVWFNMDWIEF